MSVSRKIKLLDDRTVATPKLLLESDPVAFDIGRPMIRNAVNRVVRQYAPLGRFARLFGGNAEDRRVQRGHHVDEFRLVRIAHQTAMHLVVRQLEIRYSPWIKGEPGLATSHPVELVVVVPDLVEIVVHRRPGFRGPRNVVGRDD